MNFLTYPYFLIIWMSKNIEDIGGIIADHCQINLRSIVMSNIVEACNGCAKISDGKCTVYPNPAAVMRWSNDKTKMGCSFNVKVEEKAKGKVRVGQQKQKQR